MGLPQSGVFSQSQVPPAYGSEQQIRHHCARPHHLRGRRNFLYESLQKPKAEKERLTPAFLSWHWAKSFFESPNNKMYFGDKIPSMSFLPDNKE